MSVRFLLLAAIVALNAFFASAEVALVSVRRSRLKELAEPGPRSRARRAGAAGNPGASAEPDASRGDAGQPGLGLGRRANALSGLPLAVRSADHAARTSIYIHGVSFALGFLAISFFHVVVGEVVPKNLAIEKADRLALLVAPPLLLFYRIFEPFVYRGGALPRGAFRARSARADMPEAATPPKS